MVLWFPRGLLRRTRLDVSAPRPRELPYKRLTLAEHFAAGGPKRILALDGGGVRGALTIAVLEEIEAMLRARFGGDPDFRLCDYFDLIGGTSTGSIIATLLCLGKNMSEIKTLYFDLVPKVFKKPLLPRIGLLYSLFDGRKLAEIITKEIGEVALGSDDVKTGLAIIARRVDTASNWVLFNHPNSLFFEDGDGYHGNKHYRLRDLVRASTAAPHYFQPQKIPIGGNQVGLFIDGGLTLHNNPSLQLLMLASLKGYRIDWPLGPEKLFLVSLGTGAFAEKVDTASFDKRSSFEKTLNALRSTVSTGETMIDTIMRWFSDDDNDEPVNSEIGTLKNDLFGGHAQLTYRRYNARLSSKWLDERLGVKFTEQRARRLWDMTNPKVIPDAYEVGRAMAEKLVKPEHFPAAFDLAVLGAQGA